MQRTGWYGVMALAGVLLLGGCVASYRQFSEERFSKAPDLTEACSYQWVADEPFYRTDDYNGFGWTPAANRGFPALQRNLKDLASNCQGADRKAQAHVSAHYLEYADQVNRKAMMLPLTFIQMITMGGAPMEMTNFYAVCVEADTPDGLRRAALAQGQLDAITNVWGGAQHAAYPGVTMRRRAKDQLLHQLTQQAWHKLWVQGQTLPEGTTCRGLLNALVD